MDDFLEHDQYVRRNYIIASQLKALIFDGDFDLFHFNSHVYAYATGIYLNTPHVLTLHSKITSEQLSQINAAHFHAVAITRAQKGDLPITQTIWHGIQTRKITPSYATRDSYLVTIGRIIDQKGIHNSIRIAQAAGKKLVIIGRIGNSADRQKYYKEDILPHLDGEQIIHIESASRDEVYAYLSGAEAILFPIVRPETFSLVVAESLACGTPVIASAVDPMPEILPKDLDIACVSDNIDNLIDAAKNTQRFDRRKCRLFAEEYFDNVQMARKYLDLYDQILAKTC